MRRKQEAQNASDEDSGTEAPSGGAVDPADVEDDDSEWYRKEVGEEPPRGMSLFALAYVFCLLVHMSR